MEGTISSRKRKRDKTNIPPEFQKCLSLLNTIQLREDARDFLEPVDWKGLGLDTYPETIKHPMDLGTVERKLLGGEYKDIKGFASDMRLVWENTMTFNREDSEIYSIAEALLGMFDRKFSEIEDMVKKAKESAPPPKKKAKSKASEKKGAASEKKSEKKSKASPAKADPRAGIWKQCMDIINFIKAKPEAEIFLEPVPYDTDPGLANYLDFVEKPMDLGTIEKNLQDRKFKDPEKFANDVRLVWQNAMAFNREDSDVYLLAKKFEDLFERKFKKLTKMLETEGNKMKKDREQFVNILRGMDDNEKMGELVVLIQKHCPDAMEMKQGKEIVIQVGRIDVKTLEKLVKTASE